MEDILITEVANGFLVEVGGNCACGKPIIFFYKTLDELKKNLPTVIDESIALSERIDAFSEELVADEKIN